MTPAKDESQSVVSPRPYPAAERVADDGAKAPTFPPREGSEWGAAGAGSPDGQRLGQDGQYGLEATALDSRDLPLVLAGPLLRRIEERRLVLWLATSQVARLRLELRSGEDWSLSHALEPGSPACRHLAAGRRLHYLLVDVRLTASLPVGRWIDYRLALAPLATVDNQAHRGLQAVIADYGWEDWQDFSRWATDLCYPGRTSPGFVFLPQVATLLHGSCRKPHYPSGDGLAAADDLLAALIAADGSDGAAVPGGQGAAEEGKLSAADGHEGARHSPEHASRYRGFHANFHEAARHTADNERLSSDLHANCHETAGYTPDHERHSRDIHAKERTLTALMEGNPGTRGLAAAATPSWPSALLLTGDQIYADDVGGPLLRAIHQLIPRLGLPNEMLAGGELQGLADAAALYRHPAGYYRRESLLPRHKHSYALREILFGGVEKPIFTTDSAHNHLITLGEILAMYLLVWSPAPWAGLDLDPPPGLDPAARAQYEAERQAIAAFVADLPRVRRLLAHLPVAMIFDDHDITDDWNLSREWEEIAYGHPLSRRVIGNALLGYLLNQAWGNAPEAFPDELLALAGQALATPGSEAHETCIARLLKFEQWQYTWPTTPPLVVIDSRTRRWRAETAARQPSGLLDWEALTDLQQLLRGQPAALLVSPAPIFGVKLIETLQRLVTWFGHPLMVDAENWMAHPGAAHAILNIFRHPKTPRHFVVLSGDVHYSFVYDVELRGRVRGPDIWQICASGLRNEFPHRLLAVLDHGNRWLYSPRSPLNWFTRRRHMRVIPRKPEGTPHGRRLLNGSGIGVVELDTEGVPWRIRVLLADGRWVLFNRREEESRLD